LPKGAELNPKQKAFCVEYVKDSNATQAAIRAGYSPKTASAKGCQLLRIVKIQESLTMFTEKKAKDVGVNAAWVLAEAIDLYKECRLEGDRTAANKSLDNVGRHIDIKAWDKTVAIDASDSLIAILEEARKRAQGD